MSTVKEVKILKDGEMVTPKTLVDSIYNLDGTKYKDKVYTKDEIDSKFKNYTLTTDMMNQSNYMTVNLEVGDSAYIHGSYDMPANYTFDIRSQVSGGVFFVARIVEAETKCVIREDLSGNYIVRLTNDRSCTFGDIARIYIRRLK